MLHRLSDLRRRAFSEMSAIIALGTVGLGALAFLELADETREGETHAFDTQILLSLRSPNDPGDPLGPFWVEQSVLDITALGGFAVLALMILAVCSYLLAIGRRTSALLVAGAVISGTVLSEAMKSLFDRPRPDLVAHLAETQSASFPSGHALVSAVAYLTIAALLARLLPRRRLKALVLTFGIVLTVLIGVSRVYLGVHWPTDVLAGWSLGAAWAALWWLAAWALQAQGAVDDEPERD
ncbi:MAG: phosphatase PAP2 family protein [Hyphomonadaceae bacterium]